MSCVGQEMESYDHQPEMAPATTCSTCVTGASHTVRCQQAFAAPSPPDGSLPLAFQGMIGVAPFNGAAASAPFTNPTAAPEFELSVVRHPRGVKACTWADAAGTTPNTIKAAPTTATVILRFTVSPFPRLASHPIRRYQRFGSFVSLSAGQGGPVQNGVFAADRRATVVRDQTLPPALVHGSFNRPNAWVTRT